MKAVIKDETPEEMERQQKKLWDLKKSLGVEILQKTQDRVGFHLNKGLSKLKQEF